MGVSPPLPFPSSRAAAPTKKYIIYKSRNSDYLIESLKGGVPFSGNNLIYSVILDFFCRHYEKDKMGQ